MQGSPVRKIIYVFFIIANAAPSLPRKEMLEFQERDFGLFAWGSSELAYFNCAKAKASGVPTGVYQLWESAKVSEPYSLIL